MGKNFSANNVDGKRRDKDNYPTPYCLINEYLDADPDWSDYSILEPFAGEGAIVKVLQDRGFSHIISGDIITGQDFLKEWRTFPYMITNPAYSISTETILHAKEIIADKFAMILPVAYLQGSRRMREIWLDKTYPLKAVYVYNRYPMFGDPLRDDGKIRTGMVATAMYVWERTYSGHPQIHWIDIDKYILKKGE